MIKMLHHVCIQTDKYKESLDFYTNILGFKIIFFNCVPQS